MPQEEPWDADASREIARSGGKRPPAGLRSDSETPSTRPSDEPEETDDEFEEIEEVPVRRQLSLAIAGFAGLLSVGLVLGALTSAPDSRLPYAIVLFGVQVLYLLAWVMALNPPAPGPTAAVAGVAALVADYLAVTRTEAALLPLVWVTAGGFVVALIGQLFRAQDRARLTDSWRTTLAIVAGAVAFAIPILLTRQETGTQTIIVCAVAGGVALVVARAADAVFPKPRIAAQVPRGVAGVVLGAMLGTLSGAALGSFLVFPFTPAKGAVVGLTAVVAAHLVDLAVNFGQAGRELAGDAPTFWVARHMQGPLGAFALVAPAAYALSHWFLT
ncbi:hypothetical protein JKJ07_09655 [Actinoplanes sp. LDG1-01]|uniref:Phosphatidate cytidylyltransferase n=2 Tax=Paractinoplanes lichenicola TaxID=2802976 RepID=A0ABS1VIN2_9ACTN|nr:hypothetical protein [Actinoplanes lichenicola]